MGLVADHQPRRRLASGLHLGLDSAAKPGSGRRKVDGDAAHATGVHAADPTVASPAGGRRRWGPAADLRAILRPVRPLVVSPPAARRPAGRSGRLHRPERAAAARVVLCRAPDRRGPRHLWTLPMFHANGWTFVWVVTAAGGTHVCLSKPEPAAVFRLIREEHIGWLCAAPTVLISLANAPVDIRRDAPRGVHVVTAGAPPAATTIERLEGELGWEVTQVYGLTETSPFITVCDPLPEHAALPPAERAVIKARQGVELITSGELRVVDTNTGEEVPHDDGTIGEIVGRGNVVLDGYYCAPEATG